MSTRRSGAVVSPRRRDDRGDLQSIPGIGPQLARKLRGLGCRRVGDLRGRDAQRMYEDLCKRHGGHVDRCVLYALRCAVYYASHRTHDAELLKWWNWKDDRVQPRRPPQAAP
jgi:hypothetical protein